MKRFRLRSLRYLAVMPAAGLLAAGVLLPGTASAATSADTIVNVQYPVTSGNTVIKKINTSVPLGPGTLSAAVDLTTSSLSATLSLPPATGSFKLFGIPVSATIGFIQNGAATGSVNFSANTVTSTASVTLQLTKLTIAGLNIPVGNNCESESPTSITLSSDAGFNIFGGGTLSGTYTIPEFAHCNGIQFLVNPIIAGPGNTISLTLGALKLV